MELIRNLGMKIRHSDFSQLLDMIRATSVFGQLETYRKAGLSDKRYRWDCFWAIEREQRREWVTRIYKFANDDHIDTALRKITGTN
jgi:hypothetical protein